MQRAALLDDKAGFAAPQIINRGRLRPPPSLEGITMETQKPLTIDQIKERAVCGWQMEKLATALTVEHAKDPAWPFEPFDIEDYRKSGQLLRGIHDVLDLLATKPNAYINAEALAAMEKEVRRAEGTLVEEWVQEVLKDNPEPEGVEPLPF